MALLEPIADHHNEAHTVASHSDTTATGTELETLTDGSSTTLHSHTHANATGKTANDHHNESHAIASHSDTTATGAELDTLTGGGDTTLHGHDHDGLTNFAGNEHIDHTSVTLAAGVGLSGGGDISTNRTFTIDLDGLTTETTIASGDFLTMVDITDSGSGKITFANLESTLNHDGLTNFVTGEHFLQSAITEVGTIATGVWNGTAILDGYLDSTYALLAGRAGGQTLIGDTASGGDLILQSTSHATRGEIYFGANAFYNEATNSLVIGASSPSGSDEILTLRGGVVEPIMLLNRNNNTTQKMQFIFRGQGTVSGSNPIWQFGVLNSQSGLTYATWNGSKTDYTMFLTDPADGTRMIIGNNTGARGKLTVDQLSTTAAIPVLTLDQADISEEMIEFVTTIGVGNAIEAVGAKSLTTTHFIKVTLPGGLTRYIPCGTIA